MLTPGYFNPIFSLYSNKEQRSNSKDQISQAAGSQDDDKREEKLDRVFASYKPKTKVKPIQGRVQTKAFLNFLESQKEKGLDV